MRAEPQSWWMDSAAAVPPQPPLLPQRTQEGDPLQLPPQLPQPCWASDAEQLLYRLLLTERLNARSFDNGSADHDKQHHHNLYYDHWPLKQQPDSSPCCSASSYTSSNYNRNRFETSLPVLDDPPLLLGSPAIPPSSSSTLLPPLFEELPPSPSALPTALPLSPLEDLEEGTIRALLLEVIAHHSQAMPQQVAPQATALYGEKAAALYEAPASAPSSSLPCSSASASSSSSSSSSAGTLPPSSCQSHHHQLPPPSSSLQPPGRAAAATRVENSSSQSTTPRSLQQQQQQLHHQTTQQKVAGSGRKEAAAAGASNWQLPRLDMLRWSKGTELHALGRCRPCVFFRNPVKGGCLNGHTCSFCHGDHPPQRKQPRPSKRHRTIQKALRLLTTAGILPADSTCPLQLLTPGLIKQPNIQELITRELGSTEYELVSQIAHRIQRNQQQQQQQQQEQQQTLEQKSATLLHADKGKAVVLKPSAGEEKNDYYGNEEDAYYYNNSIQERFLNSLMGEEDGGEDDGRQLKQRYCSDTSSTYSTIAESPNVQSEDARQLLDDTVFTLSRLRTSKR